MDCFLCPEGRDWVRCAWIGYSALNCRQLGGNPRLLIESPRGRAGLCLSTSCCWSEVGPDETGVQARGSAPISLVNGTEINQAVTPYNMWAFLCKDVWKPIGQYKKSLCSTKYTQNMRAPIMVITWLAFHKFCLLTGDFVRELHLVLWRRRDLCVCVSVYFSRWRNSGL